jgi:hypothetical protein
MGARGRSFVQTDRHAILMLDRNPRRTRRSRELTRGSKASAAVVLGWADEANSPRSSAFACLVARSGLLLAPRSGRPGSSKPRRAPGGSRRSSRRAQRGSPRRAPLSRGPTVAARGPRYDGSMRAMALLLLGALAGACRPAEGPAMTSAVGDAGDAGDAATTERARWNQRRAWLMAEDVDGGTGATPVVQSRTDASPVAKDPCAQEEYRFKGCPDDAGVLRVIGCSYRVWHAAEYGSWGPWTETCTCGPDLGIGVQWLCQSDF